MENRLLLTNFDRVDAAWLDAHPTVRVLGAPMTGLDSIDLEECERRGVKVVSLQGERRFLKTITSTAEHTWGLITALSRGYKAAFRGERNIGFKLAGKTIGIVGCRGRIGTQIARMAKAFGMKIIGVEKSSWNWKKMLTESDVITLHIPLVGNEGLWKTKHFEYMKRSAFFVNTSRSGVVEREALFSALTDGKIKGAAVDFVDDPELVEYERTHDNLILTPHIGGFTFEDRKLTDLFIINKMHAFSD